MNKGSGIYDCFILGAATPSVLKILVGVVFFLGIACFMNFHLLGSRVGSDGILLEPFGLLALGWIVIFLSVIGAVVLWVGKRVSNKRS